MERSTFSIILSFIAIAFAICAIYTTRPYNWELDYVGFIVALLTIMVTLLLGWNIYRVIDAKERISNIEKTNENYRRYIATIVYKLNNQVEITRHESYMNLFYIQGIIRLNLNYDHFYIIQYYNFQTALWHCLQADSDFAINNIEQILIGMESVIKRRNGDIERNDEISETNLNELKTNYNDIIQSGNKNYTIEQRERFSNIANSIRAFLT